MTKIFLTNFLDLQPDLEITALLIAALMSFTCNLYLSQVIYRLRQLNQRQNQFLAHLAHRLKTPLACVLVNLDLASLDLKEQNYGHLKRVLASAKISLIQLSNLFSNFLSLNQLTKTNQPKMADFSFSELLTKTGQHFQPLLGARKLSLKIEANLCLIGHSEKINELIWNLLDNALKFTDPKIGRIEVSCQQSDNALVLVVKDNGIGISSKDLRQIFRPYFQVKPAKASCGLGLAIVQAITKLHHGQISIQSQLNQGTTITIKLPIKIQKLRLKTFLKVFTRALKPHLPHFR